MLMMPKSYCCICKVSSNSFCDPLYLCSCVLLFTSGTEVREAQDILRKKFLKISFSKRKLWSGAPKLSKFNRKFGIVQNAPLLSELDYTSYYEMMTPFPSEIQ